MIIPGHGLMTERSGIVGLYEIQYPPYVVEAFNQFITTHECHKTYEVPSGKEILLPVERRSWKADFGTCNVGHFVTATCEACGTSKDVVSP